MLLLVDVAGHSAVMAFETGFSSFGNSAAELKISDLNFSWRSRFL